MHTTVEQNRAHRNDQEWIRTPRGEDLRRDGESYLSEYLNPWTGEAIRKCWRMTGRDWIRFDDQGRITGRYATLTIAKMGF